MNDTDCIGCGFCCLSEQCQESHVRYGSQRRCPELYFDQEQGLYRCRLSSQGRYWQLSLLGVGCQAPGNPYRAKAAGQAGPLR